MNFVARQIKSRLREDKCILLASPPEHIPKELWHIVCGYTCEDPRIVDLIVNKDWCVISGDDFEGRMKIDHSRCGECGLSNISYELWHDGTVQWATLYDEMFEILLMLPQTAPDGDECECSVLTIHDVRMRELLYRELK